SGATGPGEAEQETLLVRPGATPLLDQHIGIVGRVGYVEALVGRVAGPDLPPDVVVFTTHGGWPAVVEAVAAGMWEAGTTTPALSASSVARPRLDPRLIGGRTAAHVQAGAEVADEVVREVGGRLQPPELLWLQGAGGLVDLDAVRSRGSAQLDTFVAERDEIEVRAPLVV